MHPPSGSKLLLDLRPLQTGYAKKGVGRYTREMAVAIHRRYPGCRSLLLGYSDNPLPQIQPLIFMPKLKRPWIWDQLILPLLLIRHKIRIFQNFVALGPLHEISLPIAFGFRTHAVVHDLMMFYEDTSPINRFYRNTMRIKIQKIGLPFVRHCCADSLKTVEELLQFTSIKKKKLQMVPVGCDHADNWKMNNPIPDKPPFILTIGDTINKNLSLGYSIVKKLRIRRPALNWVICGNSDSVSGQLKKTIGKIPWIKIMDKINDEVMAGLYDKARLLLFTSTKEGFGIPVIEAMRLGCPVVAGNIRPVMDHLGYDSGLNPYLSDNQNINRWVHASNNILNDEDLRKKHIQYGEYQSQKFLWEDCANRLMEKYPELI